MGHLLVKRIYDPVDKADGIRILVDRLWPRGITKERAQLYRWMKEVAPSTELRKQFHANPQNWAAFQHDYLAELRQAQASVQELAELVKNNQVVTLLYATNNQEHNHALVLKQFLQGKE